MLIDYSVMVSIRLPRKEFSFLGVQKVMGIYLFGVLRRLQHCTGHITTGSWKGRGNQYIELVRKVMRNNIY